MKSKVLNTHAEYEMALKRLDELFSKRADSKDIEDMLLLTKQYEGLHCHTPADNYQMLEMMRAAKNDETISVREFREEIGRWK